MLTYEVDISRYLFTTFFLMARWIKLGCRGLREVYSGRDADSTKPLTKLNQLSKSTLQPSEIKILRMYNLMMFLFF